MKIFSKFWEKGVNKLKVIEKKVNNQFKSHLSIIYFSFLIDQKLKNHLKN